MVSHTQGFGAYKFTAEYGDINDYSPIYDPTKFAADGNQYKPGASNHHTYTHVPSTIEGSQKHHIKLKLIWDVRVR